MYVRICMYVCMYVHVCVTYCVQYIYHPTSTLSIWPRWCHQGHSIKNKLLFLSFQKGGGLLSPHTPITTLFFWEFTKNTCTWQNHACKCTNRHVVKVQDIANNTRIYFFLTTQAFTFLTTQAFTFSLQQ